MAKPQGKTLDDLQAELTKAQDAKKTAAQDESRLKHQIAQMVLHQRQERYKQIAGLVAKAELTPEQEAALEALLVAVAESVIGRTANPLRLWRETTLATVPQWEALLVWGEDSGGSRSVSRRETL